jgi:hypothetical protein
MVDMIKSEYGFPLMPGDSATWSRDVPRTAPQPREKTVKADAPLPAEVVYFLRCGKDGPIKIGWTAARNLLGRISNLQVAHHELLSLIGFTEGGQTTEREWHERFSAIKIRGEWFEPAPELLAEIAKATKL